MGREIIQSGKTREDRAAVIKSEVVVDGVETILLAAAELTMGPDGKEVAVAVPKIQGMAVPKRAIEEGLISEESLCEFLMQEYLNYKYGMLSRRNERVIMPQGRT